MTEFKVGDVVQLKSGGPKMTVTLVRPSGAVMAYWFGSYEEKPLWEEFPPASVVYVPADKYEES